MKIAFLGTGLMGQPMAARLIEQGHAVSAYNRTPAKVQDLTDVGAQACVSPAAAMQGADWAVTMLSDAAALQAVLLAPPTRDALGGQRVLNMATIAPHQARELGAAVASAGGEFMECPVLGSIPEAKAGSLILMFGGTEAQFAAAQALLLALGPKPRRIGALGQASALKLAMNQLIASLTAAFSLSLGMIRAEGVDPDTFMSVVRDSALYAPTYDKKLARMLERNFDNPNFPVKHLLKDVRLVTETAARDGLDTRLLDAIEAILVEATEQGSADLDYSALYNVVHPR